MAKLVALDAGHGLQTAGKQTPDGIKEWTLNDKVRDKVVKLLKGYDVNFVFPDNNEGKTDENLESRRKIYIDKDADAVVSIHHNAFKGTWGTATGTSVFIDKNATAGDIELANLIATRLSKYTGLKNRGVHRENFYVINQNSIPAVLTEGGFMDTKKDYAVITSDKGQEAYAKAIAEALIEFLDLKKKNSTTTAKKTTSDKTPFKVKLLEPMSVRIGAGTNHAKVMEAGIGVYTIKKVKYVGKVPWGKLKSGIGWMCIADKYCVRV